MLVCSAPHYTMGNRTDDNLAGLLRLQRVPVHRFAVELRRGCHQRKQLLSEGASFIRQPLSQQQQ